MATPSELITGIQSVPGLDIQILNQSFLRIVEKVYSKEPEPDPRKYGSAVAGGQGFFKKRINGASTVVRSVQYINIPTGDVDADGNPVTVEVADPKSLSNPKFGVVMQGFASHLVESEVSDNPGKVAEWAGMTSAEVATEIERIVGAVLADTDKLDGIVELMFNGPFCGVTTTEMQFAVELGLWTHPLGRTDFS
jgi:hypothetical protein